MSANQWKLAFGVVGAIVAYLLIQTDVPLDPLVKVVLGALTVGLAVVNPDRSSPAPSIPATEPDAPSDGAMGAH